MICSYFTGFFRIVCVCVCGAAIEKSVQQTQTVWPGSPLSHCAVRNTLCLQTSLSFLTIQLAITERKRRRERQEACACERESVKRRKDVQTVREKESKRETGAHLCNCQRMKKGSLERGSQDQERRRKDPSVNIHTGLKPRLDRRTSRHFYERAGCQDRVYIQLNINLCQLHKRQINHQTT